MENICAKALMTGPAEGRLEMKEVLIKSVYKIAGYYPEFYRSVFKREAAFTICMLADPNEKVWPCLLYTSPSPRDGLLSRMPSSA